MRPIDADALLEEAEKEVQLFLKSKDSVDAKKRDEVRKIQIALYQIVGSAPTIEPKRGKWLKTHQSLVYPDIFRNYFCSVCGFELDAHIRKEPNYCPNCGAKMERGEE